MQPAPPEPEPSYRSRRAPRDEERAVRGLALHLARWPGADPEPWLLLHGWADAGATFQFLADALPDGRTLVAPDWRGFGRSAWPADGYWFPDYYADLDALITQLSPARPVVLVGHSMGANIAMMYGGIRPERVRAIVNIEGFGLPPARPEQAPERYRAWLAEESAPPQFARFPSHAAFTQYLRRRNPRLTAERADFVARAWACDAPGGGVRMRADPRHKRVNPVLYRREEAEACWRAISAPLLLVVAGDSDHAARFGGVSPVARMRELVPQLAPASVADAGHMVHHEQPVALAAVIEEFIGALERPATR